MLLSDCTLIMHGILPLFGWFLGGFGGLVWLGLGSQGMNTTGLIPPFGQRHATSRRGTRRRAASPPSLGGRPPYHRWQPGIPHGAVWDPWPTSVGAQPFSRIFLRPPSDLYIPDQDWDHTRPQGTWYQPVVSSHQPTGAPSSPAKTFIQTCRSPMQGWILRT